MRALLEKSTRPSAGGSSGRAAVAGSEWQGTVSDHSDSYAFDGLGRLGQVTEAYPSGSGYRSRFELDLFLPEGEECVSSGGLPYRTRVKLASEWIDGESFPAGGCTAPGLHWTETQLDTLGRPAYLRKPDGSELGNTFIGDTTVISARSVAVDTSGNEQIFTRSETKDALGRLRILEEERVSGGEIFTASYGYDHQDRLTSVKLWNPGMSASQDRSYAYSGAGFLLSSTEPERSTTFSAYDALGNLKTESSWGITSTYVYDGFGRPITKTVGGALAAEHFYGDAPPAGVPTAYPFDKAYNQVVRSIQHNPHSSDVTVTHNWSYNEAGGRVSQRRTAVSVLDDGDLDFFIGYAYDTWGNLRWLEYPTWQGCRFGDWDAILYQHDGSYLTSIFAMEEGAPPKAIASYQYHPSGRVKTLLYGNGATLDEAADPNGMARPLSLRLSDGWPPAWESGDYEYDGAGNIKTIGSKHYAYDGLNRLTAFSDTYASSSYTYDRWGNLKSISRDGQSLSLEMEGVALPTTNRISTVNGYALGWTRGNLTTIPYIDPQQRRKSFVYSYEDRLLRATDVASGTTWRYGYDAGGERVAAWSSTTGEARFFVRDDSGQVLSEWFLTGDHTGFDVSRDYVYGGTGAVAQADYTAGEGELSFLAADHLGSTRVVFTEDGAVTDRLDYYPFGSFLEGGPTPDTTHLFTGHERELGDTSPQVDYMHARYYSPVLSRFVSVDPIRPNGGSSQPWNRYAYALNNPIRLIDPNGADPFDPNNPQATSYRTADNAALDAASYIVVTHGGLTFKQEYGTWIYQNEYGFAYDEPGTQGHPGRYEFGAPPKGWVTSVHTQPFTTDPSDQDKAHSAGIASPIFVVGIFQKSTQLIRWDPDVSADDGMPALVTGHPTAVVVSQDEDGQHVVANPCDPPIQRSNEIEGTQSWIQRRRHELKQMKTENPGE
jgi:RHS repeat-associated protein